MEAAVLDAIFDEFIKALPSSLGKLLNKAYKVKMTNLCNRNSMISMSTVCVGAFNL